MKTQHQQRIEAFMRLAKQKLPGKPVMPSEHIRLLRAKLILEEALETISKGLGVEVTTNKVAHVAGSYMQVQVPVTEVILDFKINGPGDLVELADGCGDVSVVTIGTLSACGIQDQDLLEEIDTNNMRKFGPGSHMREDGKVLKPSGHRPPCIERVLKEQGYED